MNVQLIFDWILTGYRCTTFFSRKTQQGVSEAVRLHRHSSLDPKEKTILLFLPTASLFLSANDNEEFQRGGGGEVASPFRHQ